MFCWLTGKQMWKAAQKREILQILARPVYIIFTALRPHLLKRAEQGWIPLSEGVVHGCEILSANLTV